MRFADLADALIHRHYFLIGSILVLLMAAGFIARDARDKMWMDELFTLLMGGQPNFAEIVHASMDGVDTAPPLYSTIVHSVLPWVRNEALAVRLTSTLGFGAMALCLLIFCSRFLPRAFALTAVIVTCDAARYYATEGRGYGLLLGAAAGALLAWQSAADGRRRALSLIAMGGCLALMVAIHYYGVLLIGPIFVAELVKWRRSGKPDCAAFAAMTPPVFVLYAHRALIAALGVLHARTTSPAQWWQISDYYARYASVWIPLLPVFLIGFLFRRQDWRRRIALISPPLLALLAALAVAPAVMVALTLFAKVVFVHRYALCGAIGTSLLPLLLLSAVARQARHVGLLSLAIAGPLLALHIARPFHGPARLQMGEDEFVSVMSLPDSSEPIVVSSNQVFMELAYYLPERYRNRLVHPFSRELEFADSGHDTVAVMMGATAHHSRLPIEPYTDLVARRSKFLVVVSEDDHLPGHLIASGYHLTSVAPRIYEAVRP